MHYLDEKQEVVFPVRLMQSVGQVSRADNLLVPKSLALLPTFQEEQTTLLEKHSEERTYVLLDFGRELHGGIRLLCPRVGPINLKLRLVFGESVTEAMSNVGEQGATNHHSPRDITVELSNLSVLDFGQTGFRFCRIEMVENGYLWLKNVVAVLKTANIEQKGYIRTSDERFNQVLDTALYTAYLNVQNGVIWDGIKRDRLVWSGDLNAEILTLGYTYGPIRHIRNCLELLRQDTPKHLWMNNIPSYSVWWVLNLVDYYYLSGDQEFFEANLDYVQYVLNDMDVCIGDNDVDMLRSGKVTERPFFLDWPTADTEDAFPGTMMLVLYTMQKLQKIPCDVLDQKQIQRILSRVQKYTELKADMKETLAMQICCGTNKPDQKALMEEKGANGFSTFMMYFILKALDKCGSEKTVELAKEYYGAMLDRGATSFWEDFDIAWLEGSGRIDEFTPEGLKDLHADYGKFCYKNLRHSLCHGWASGVVSYAFENVLGVSIVEPGYRKVHIAPKLVGLDWVEGEVPTPMGNIHVRAEAGKAPKITLPQGVELL